MRGKITSPVTGNKYQFEITPEVYGESMGHTEPRWRDDCGSQVTVTGPWGIVLTKWVDSLSIALGGERDAIQDLAERIDAEVAA